MHSIIDLRSDTVTRPGAGMRQAMSAAEVGDDVYDDDPSVNLLQERCAALLGKEAALFVPSGTMSNAIAIKTHTKPGDEILLDGEAHSMLYELGLPATIAGVVTRQFPSDIGMPQIGAFSDLIHKETLHTPATSLIVLENTHNRSGGTVIPLSLHEQIWKIAVDNGLRVHIDGARLFNAVVASGTSASEFARYADSVTFCLSKGLGCPVGSVLCGTAEFIGKARRVRKMLGGGLRQVGILAAAGLYALDNNIGRLVEDHANARLLAQALDGADGISVANPVPATNMVYINTARLADEICAELKDHSIIAESSRRHRIRLVTHMDVDAEDVTMAATVIKMLATN